MTEEMEKIINAEDRHMVVQAYAGCVDRDTEYFNGKEWVKISEYKQGDKVLQFNEDWTTELVEPMRYIKQPCGKMYHFKDRNVDMMLSEEHRVVYMDEHRNIKEILCKDLVEQLSKTPHEKYWIIKPFGEFRYNVYVFEEISSSTQIEEVVPIDGMKYCFTVPSHMLVLRRNNIFVTGNSGKSSTMLEYVKAHPNEKILFLVFNKSMATEFSNRLKGVQHNCEVKTIHALAYRWYLSKGYPKKKFENLNIVDIQSILGLKKVEYEELSKIRFYYNMFLTSNVNEPNELELLEKTDVYYIPHVYKLWKYFESKNSSEMQHNVYLKMFQLSKVQLNYDTIILDESNDTNQCMLDILVANKDKKIIAVGDSRQMINSFNFNIDGLTYLVEKHGFKEYKLTNSFRVSEDVASLSSRYMQYMYDDPKFKFSGLGDTKFSKLKLELANTNNPIHLLCRTRLGGLKQIANVLTYERDKKVYFMGGLKSFGIDEIKRVLAYKGTVYLGGKKFHISELRIMKNEGLDDPEVNRLISIYDFVRKDEYVINLLENSEVTDIKDADIILLTSHSSKGLTLKNVILGNDFPPIEETKTKRATAKHSYLKAMADSEANLLYVALTRATHMLDYGQALNKTEKREYEKQDLDY